MSILKIVSYFPSSHWLCLQKYIYLKKNANNFFKKHRMLKNRWTKKPDNIWSERSLKKSAQWTKKNFLINKHTSTHTHLWYTHTHRLGYTWTHTQVYLRNAHRCTHGFIQIYILESHRYSHGYRCTSWIHTGTSWIHRHTHVLMVHKHRQSSTASPQPQTYRWGMG